MHTFGICANCGALLAGRYCHRCGQREVEPDALHLTRIVRQILRAATTLDSKTLRSLAGLLRPVFLTAEYLAGRRQPYLGPVKIYLVPAAIFFLTAPLAGFTLEALRERESTSPPGSTCASRRCTPRCSR